MDDSITANGNTYCLKHLNSLETQATLELRGGFKKAVRITVVFLNHCYTRSVTDEELAANVHPPGDLIQDGSEEDPRLRVFCADRYNLSFSLPSLIQQLIDNSGKVYETSYHNVLSVQLAPLSNSSIPYVFFMRVSKEKAQKKLLIHIESAYSYNPSDPPFSLNKPQGIMTWLRRAWEK